MTFLIDDDIVIEKHNNFLNKTILEYRKKSNCIIGANLGGIMDESYFGRILYGIAKNLFSEWKKKDSLNSDTRTYNKHPLWLPPKKSKVFYMTNIPVEDFWHSNLIGNL